MWKYKMLLKKVLFKIINNKNKKKKLKDNSQEHRMSST